jgi:hypothetical protein
MATVDFPERKKAASSASGVVSLGPGAQGTMLETAAKRNYSIRLEPTTVARLEELALEVGYRRRRKMGWRELTRALLMTALDYCGEQRREPGHSFS